VPLGAIAWAKVKELTEAGATEEDIVAGLGISAETLKDPATQARFHEAVKRGNAYGRLLLQEAIAKRGARTTKGAGSVNALSLRARNLLDWDKGLVTVDPPPDLSGAHARLKVTLEKLAKVRSAELGRIVDPAEILIAEAYPGIDAQKVLAALTFDPNQIWAEHKATLQALIDQSHDGGKVH
jgi:uncharacterized protein (DUF433 family)